ncbi:hypothetical protein [Kitasatospora sp. NPDC094015]|uniref:hypothetical protein n=1 Tax=Kitasatospora sp. NPDC094015 TaxID=3155205 RepID=UPI0033275A8B
MLATGGGLLARAQYATSIRPMIGFDVRVIRIGPDADAGALAWGCQIRNGAQDAATVQDIRYAVRLVGGDPATADTWLDPAALTAELERVGLRTDVDHAVKLWGCGAPLAGQERAVLGWFSPHAMTVIDSLCVRVQVLDRVGDLHERTNRLLTERQKRPPHQATPDR